MPTFDLVALGKWLSQPKSWLRILPTLALVWGLYQAYSFVHDRGAASRDKEIVQLQGERDEAVAKYNKYKGEYENWVTNTRDAQVRFLLEQGQTIKTLQLQLAEAEARAANKPVTIKEVIRYVPAEVDVQYPLPVGFVSLYSESLQGRPDSHAANGDLPGSRTFDVGEASPLTLSQFGLIASSNNAECVLRGEIIDSWQTWYYAAKEAWERRQEAVFDTTPDK